MSLSKLTGQSYKTFALTRLKPNRDEKKKTVLRENQVEKMSSGKEKDRRFSNNFWFEFSQNVISYILNELSNRLWLIIVIVQLTAFTIVYFSNFDILQAIVTHSKGITFITGNIVIKRHFQATDIQCIGENWNNIKPKAYIKSFLYNYYNILIYILILWWRP